MGVLISDKLNQRLSIPSANPFQLSTSEVSRAVLNSYLLIKRSVSAPLSRYGINKDREDNASLSKEKEFPLRSLSRTTHSCAEDENAPPVSQWEGLENTRSSQRRSCTLPYIGNSSDTECSGAVQNPSKSQGASRSLKTQQLHCRTISNLSQGALDGDSGSNEAQITAIVSDRQRHDYCTNAYGGKVFAKRLTQDNLDVTKLGRRLRPSQTGYNVHRSDKTSQEDRFVRRLSSLSQPKTNLLVNKPVSCSSQSDLLLRRNIILDDPFRARVRIRRRLALSTRLPQRPELVGAYNNIDVLHPRRKTALSGNRQVSAGAVWSVGGSGPVADPNLQSVPAHNPVLVHVPALTAHSSRFLEGSTPAEDEVLHESRLALALDIDQTRRVIDSKKTSSDRVRAPASPWALNVTGTRDIVSSIVGPSHITWRDNEWQREGAVSLLEAPNLRDDYYCSVLAYSHTADLLAVGLGDKVYLWSEGTGVQNPPIDVNSTVPGPSFVTSLSFSSLQGCSAILAVGRGDGRVCLWSPLDEEPRCLKVTLSSATAAVSFRPSTVRRPSQIHSGGITAYEVLVVGDDTGIISIYLVEWPSDDRRFLFSWHGSIVLHSKINAHSQQICGIAWAPDGEYFATGGNDNLCCLFQFSRILTQNRERYLSLGSGHQTSARTDRTARTPGEARILTLEPNPAVYQWRLNAAIKAVAFCPWQRGLLALGGGSNDRAIHFYHTFSGASLANIDCAAQVTSLIWSNSRREIAATLGFAQPEHPYRIAVYSWPKCQQVMAIPWNSEMRALYAIPYPRRRGTKGQELKRKGRRDRRAAPDNGCIAVASSDCSIKFHEIWSEEGKAVGARQGILGGSDILESLHGIEKDGKDVIR